MEQVPFAVSQVPKTEATPTHVVNVSPGVQDSISHKWSFDLKICGGSRYMS